MSRKNMKQSDLELRLAHPESNQDTNRVAEAVLIDRTSGKTIAILELTLRDYHNLMTGRRVGSNQGSSYLATPSDLAKLRHRKVNISRVLHGISYMDNMREKVEEWATEAARWMGTDEASVSRNNGGNWMVTLSFYIAPADVDDEDAVRQFKIRRTEQLANLTTKRLEVQA